MPTTQAHLVVTDLSSQIRSCQNIEIQRNHIQARTSHMQSRQVGSAMRSFEPHFGDQPQASNHNPVPRTWDSTTSLFLSSSSMSDQSSDSLGRRCSLHTGVKSLTCIHRSYLNMERTSGATKSFGPGLVRAEIQDNMKELSSRYQHASPSMRPI